MSWQHLVFIIPPEFSVNRCHRRMKLAACRYPSFSAACTVTMSPTAPSRSRLCTRSYTAAYRSTNPIIRVLV